MDATIRVRLAKQAHESAFGKPSFGHRGYYDREVDDFLDKLVSDLLGATEVSHIIWSVQSAGFRKSPIGLRGYAPDDVDELLGSIVSQLVSDHPDKPAPPTSAAPQRVSAVTDHPSGFLRRLFGA